ncbi:MAG: hypothetical protein ACYS18_09130 [Planctomycetota bacterium]
MSREDFFVEGVFVFVGFFGEGRAFSLSWWWVVWAALVRRWSLVARFWWLVARGCARVALSLSRRPVVWVALEMGMGLW